MKFIINIIILLLWFLFYILTLGIISFDIKYRNGLYIHAIGWPEILKNRKRKIK